MEHDSKLWNSRNKIEQVVVTEVMIPGCREKQVKHINIKGYDNSDHNQRLQKQNIKRKTEETQTIDFDFINDSEQCKRYLGLE